MNKKTVVITGGSSGIGEATALLFAKEGAEIIITYNNNHIGARKVCDKVKELGASIYAIKADFSYPEEVEKLWDEIERKFDKIDILINNAGVLGGQPFLTSSVDHWQEVMQVNFLSAVQCSQRAVKMMSKQKKGKIINTSSIRGLNHCGREGVMAYSSAKSALNNFTLTLAKELAPDIQVNAITPGFVDTAYYDSIDSTVRNKFIENSLIDRFVYPKEVAEGFLFLANSASITGHILNIDAGYSLVKG